MSLCDDSWDLIQSYGVRLSNASGITNPVFRHWCQQKPVSEASHYLIGVILVLICIISVIGNLMVVVVFSRYRRLRSPANILIVNLATSDLLNGLLHPMAAYSAFKGHWSFGREGPTFGKCCETYAALCGLFGLVSIVTLTAIALERCLVISVKPWHGTVLFTHSKAKGAIGIVWFYCLILVLPPVALGWGAFVPEGFLTSCSFDYLSRTRPNRAYFFFLFSFGFFLPIILIGVCYTFILQTIFQNERTMKLNHVIKSHQSNVKRSEFRAAEMILMVIALFLISWTPYSLIACLGQFGNKSLLTPWVSVLPSLFAKMSTLYNPAIYGLSHRHFRAALKRMFERNSRRSRSGTYFSKNSSLGKTKNGCPCLPINCTSDVLEDNSSSLVGKKIVVGSPQDIIRPVCDRKSLVREEFCVSGKEKMVPRHLICKLDDSSSCFQNIPAPTRLRCDHPTSCMSNAKKPFCGRESNSLMKTHVFKARYEQIQEMHAQVESATPEKLYPDDNSVRHRDALSKCFQSFQCACGSYSDFTNSSVLKYRAQRSESKTVPYKRGRFAMSVESGLVHRKRIPSAHLTEISYSSARSVHECCNDSDRFPVLYLMQEGEIKIEGKVSRGKGSDSLSAWCGGGGGVQRPSMRFSPIKQSSCEFRESEAMEVSSCNFENPKSAQAFSKPECRDKFKSRVLAVKSKSSLNFQNHSASTQNPKSMSFAISQEELPVCLKCSSCGEDFATNKSNSNKGEQISGVHPSLTGSLLFRSERAIHQMLFECDHVIRVTTAKCFRPDFFGKCCPRAAVVLEGGQLRGVIRSSSANET